TATFSRGDCKFALVPGGEAELGYARGMIDLDVSLLCDDDEEEVPDDEEEGLVEFELDSLDRVMSPRRRGCVPPMLVEIEAREICARVLPPEHAAYSWARAEPPSPGFEVCTVVEGLRVRVTRHLDGSLRVEAIDAMRAGQVAVKLKSEG